MNNEYNVRVSAMGKKVDVQNYGHAAFCIGYSSTLNCPRSVWFTDVVHIIRFKVLYVIKVRHNVNG